MSNDISRTDLLELDRPVSFDASEGYTARWSPVPAVAPADSATLAQALIPPSAEVVEASRPPLPVTGAAARVAAASAGTMSVAEMRATRAPSAPSAARVAALEVERQERQERASAIRLAHERRLSAESAIAAGAIEGADGRLISWAGRGSLTLGRLIEALTVAGCPTTWAPKPISVHGHLGRVLHTLTISRKYAVRAVPKHKGAAWRARWQIGSISGGEVGDPFGRITHTVTMMPDDTYTFTSEHQDGVEADVRAKVTALCAAETLLAADITSWLDITLRHRFGALRLGVALYLPAATCEQAERLCAEMASSWGESWMLPAIPVVTSGALGHNLYQAAIEELRTIGRDAAEQKSGRGTTRLVTATEEVMARALALEVVLGPELAGDLRARAGKLLANLRTGMDDASARAAVLEF
jgi:hypothetical protein